MKVVSSIKSAKLRHPDCQVVRRKGRIYVINKTEPQQQNAFLMILDSIVRRH